MVTRDRSAVGAGGEPMGAFCLVEVLDLAVAITGHDQASQATEPRSNHRVPLVPGKLHSSLGLSIGWVQTQRIPDDSVEL
jgi:hypothetical protein